jgi:hypothetical protein
MNIFVTDYDPIIAAENLADVHLNKIIIESAQMLSTYIWWINGNKPDNVPHQVTRSWTEKEKQKYKALTGLCLPCYGKHDCNIWLRKDIKNVHWLHLHFIHLLLEYEYRKNKAHGCQKYEMSIYEYLKDVYPTSTPRPDRHCLCMPDEFKTDDAVQSYRNYYISKQYSMKVPMIWTNSMPPDWFIFKSEIHKEILNY